MSKNYIGSTGLKKIFNLLWKRINIPITISWKDYDISPPSNSSIVILPYDITNEVPDGYVPIFSIPFVSYTSSHAYNQITICNYLNQLKGNLYINCLNTTPFHIRIYILVVNKLIYK